MLKGLLAISIDNTEFMAMVLMRKEFCGWAYVILLYHVCHSALDRHFKQAINCPNKVIGQAYRYRTLDVRSVLECVTQCQPDDHCLSFVFDADNNACYLGNSTSVQNCSNMESASGRMRFYEMASNCQHRGEVNPSGGCSCRNSNNGTDCNWLMPDCTEGTASGSITADGVYTIQPALSPTSFPVYCYLASPNTRTLILNRENHNTVFNRTWNDYRDGFGDLRGDFWLGLEKIHLLTISKTYELRFRIRLSNKTIYYSFYRDFVLNDEASGYTFSFSSYRLANGADCLTSLQGARFSAYDVDNDNSTVVNCAAIWGAGWWFLGDSCSACNPMGPILPPYDGLRRNVTGEAFWSGLGNISPFAIKAYLVVK